MRVTITLFKLFLNLIYIFFKLLPTQNKVVFLSRQSNTPSIDITMLKKEISETHSDFRTVVLCKKIESGILNKLKYIAHIFTQMYHISTSRVAIIDSFCIPISILKHKKSLLVIQMWHSVGTMKKFGYSILDEPEGHSSKVAKLMNMHKGYDYILCAGTAYVHNLSEGFNYPVENIVILPLPRVELLQNEDYIDKTRKAISSKYPILKSKDKKNIVYVPTFRKSNDCDITLAIEELCKTLNTSRYNLVIKVHPLTKIDSLQHKYGNIIFDDNFSSMEMLTISDIIISDYSCIIYEGAILHKPIYFYAYDYDTYMRNRSVYPDYVNEMPGPICSTASSLLNKIDDQRYDFDRLKTFLNRYVSTTGHETSDIVEFIWKNLK